ncbi:hypothetical protein B0H14DRAFT_3867403 [Mycena olivaceomarginata]|nr:hypothetical protein B0H14DRAFT_3867403 [Mycena olivaceomarginata]
MHPILRVAEIVDLIFAQLQSPDTHLPMSRLNMSRHSISLSRQARNAALGRRDFAVLARTCKSFQGPALDFLWREQDTLTNLLKCLPSHLWEEETRITGPIHPADWEIPLAYASRIQKLELQPSNLLSDSELSLATNVFEILGATFPHDHLCPNLQALSFDAAIFLPDFTAHVASLPDLPIRYSQLQKLYLDTGSPAPKAASHILSQIALKLDRIETLTLDKVDRLAISHLSGLSALRALRLEYPDIRDLGPSSPSRSLIDSQATPFSVLRELYFYDTTIEFVIEFLDQLFSCGLVNLHIGTGAAALATKSVTRQLYTALAAHLSHSALRTLEVELPENVEMQMPTPTGDGLANYVIDGSIFGALFCFANLTKITLAPPAGFNLDDATAWDMARAWPKLESLRLTTGTDRPHPSSMTLLGLRAFAKHCHELTSLTITFDATTVPPLDDSPEATVSQSRLSSLDVGTSPISDPFTVAQFMSGLFLNMENIATFNEWIWEDVEDVDADGDTAAAYDQFSRWKQVEAALLKSQGATEVLNADA